MKTKCHASVQQLHRRCLTRDKALLPPHPRCGAARPQNGWGLGHSPGRNGFLRCYDAILSVLDATLFNKFQVHIITLLV